MAFGDFIQSNTTTGGSGAATTPTLGAGATAGNLLVLMLSRSAGSGTLPTVTGFTAISDDVSGNLTGAWWYMEASGGETTVTLSGESGTGTWRLCLAEFEGPFPASPLDVQAEDVTNVSTVVTSQSTGTTGTTSQADALALGFWTADGAANVDGTRGYTNSFTERVFEHGLTSSARAAIILASKVLAATGTVECTFSCTDTGDEMYGAVAVFKKDAGGGGSAAGPLIGGKLVNHSVLLGRLVA